jgi:hypothetical protein
MQEIKKAALISFLVTSQVNEGISRKAAKRAKNVRSVVILS